MPAAAFELFLAKVAGLIPSAIEHEEGRELVVVVADDGYTPIDVVSNQNFLSLTRGEKSGTSVICSLAIEASTGKSYKHRVEFSDQQNAVVIRAALRWREARSS